MSDAMRASARRRVFFGGLGAFLIVCVLVCSCTPEPPASRLEVDLGDGVRIDFVLIRPGTFVMGSDDSLHPAENPPHTVTLTRPFYLARHEVTQAQWEKLMGNNPSQFKGAQNPVETVSWDECRSCVEKLRGKVKLRGWVPALPTEAQWEYACRAGSTTDYCFGNDGAGLTGYAWHGEDLRGTTHPVGGKRPNAWGLHDMHGNVWEWCADWFGDYAADPVTDPKGPASGDRRVYHGGSWCDAAWFCRSAHRSAMGPAGRSPNRGLRLALVVPGG